jgi:hypothetical protein
MPQGSAGKNEAEDEIKNDAIKSKTKRSSDGKNQPAHSIIPPTPDVTTAKPGRLGDQLDGSPPRSLCRSAQGEYPMSRKFSLREVAFLRTRLL